MKKETNVLFVVRALPFEAAGTPIVIRSLLSHLPPENYFVLGRRPDPSKRLPNIVKQKMFQIPILYTKGHTFWKYFSIIPGFFMGVWIIQKYKITKLVGVFQDDASLILSYWLALFFKNVEFYPYLMDLYAEQQAKRDAHQKLIFQRANKILVANDGICDLLRKKHEDFKFVTIPIIATNTPASIINRKFNSAESKFKIVYSGSVNADRIETLKIATKIISKDERIVFKYLTNHSKEYLTKHEVFYDRFEIGHCKSSDELMLELNEAHLLYLPIRFNFPEEKKAQMQTVFGAKTFEYLVSQTPTLVHCPSDFFNSIFFKEHNAGYVLNSNEEEEFEKCINDIILNYNERATAIVINAHAAAEQFSDKNVIVKFLNAVESN